MKTLKELKKGDSFKYCSSWFLVKTDPKREIIPSEELCESVYSIEVEFIKEIKGKYNITKDHLFNIKKIQGLSKIKYEVKGSC